jgi:hypothetical protein
MYLFVACGWACFSPDGELLSFASPKESNQRKGDPTSPPFGFPNSELAGRAGLKGESQNRSGGTERFDYKLGFDIRRNKDCALRVLNSP